MRKNNIILILCGFVIASIGYNISMQQKYNAAKKIVQSFDSIYYNNPQHFLNQYASHRNKFLGSVKSKQTDATMYAYQVYSCQLLTDSMQVSISIPLEPSALHFYFSNSSGP